MKSLKVLCAIAIIASFFSCAYQEDTVAFFIENDLSKDLLIERIIDEDQSTSILKITELDLTSIASYDKYIKRLVDLDITKVNCSFSNYEGVITEGQLFLDGILLGGFQNNMENIIIEDPEILSIISERFLEKTSLDFSFVGESNSQHSLKIDIDIEMLGTFVH
jgi:hypothetical protein|tara:strand:+ start:8935 stop:9426 length:492 start_codon:yes stop_codon:yes gene_type:complete